ncbi:anti-sigma factor [Muriicola marianensis]|uniref:Regulator of SigK n=1 Tax=Muriicola marianensis TaxID=1324801 RepID=A0ABQ1QSB2_9FLAO|nr:anti-sigma factor [Muriicola marianensis]GGD43529.1 hypothetical protein GCM10011361_08140 [Muriicola marianensis]
MDRKTILEKGLLLPYLLDELDEKERLEVEKVLAEDAILKAELNSLESSFEKMALENAVAPPSSIRKRLEDTLGAAGTTPDEKVRSIRPKTGFDGTRLLVAASLAALFALTSFWFYSRWQDAEENIRLVREEQQQLQKSIEVLSNELQDVQQLNGLLADRDVIPVLMEGNRLSPEARAVAFLNHKTRSVLVNPKALPKLSTEETYQMWADVDGEMINMGLVPTDQDLVSLAYIEGAESLNITIEPKGGSEHPTVERLISNVYL